MYILILIRLCGWVSDKFFFTRQIFGNKTTFFALTLINLVMQIFHSQNHYRLKSFIPVFMTSDFSFTMLQFFGLVLLKFSIFLCVIILFIVYFIHRYVTIFTIISKSTCFIFQKIMFFCILCRTFYLYQFFSHFFYSF